MKFADIYYLQRKSFTIYKPLEMTKLIGRYDNNIVFQYHTLDLCQPNSTIHVEIVVNIKIIIFVILQFCKIYLYFLFGTRIQIHV